MRKFLFLSTMLVSFAVQASDCWLRAEARDISMYNTYRMPNYTLFVYHDNGYGDKTTVAQIDFADRNSVEQLMAENNANLAAARNNPYSKYVFVNPTSAQVKAERGMYSIKEIQLCAIER